LQNSYYRRRSKVLSSVVSIADTEVILQEVDNEAGWKIYDEAETTARFEEVKKLLGNKRR
jgi:hypothetical protein